MIATRRRRRHFPFKRYFKLAVTAIVVYELCAVPLTHKLIFDGPLKPFWGQVSALELKYVQPYAGPALEPLIKPLHFAFQQKQLVDRAHEITTLKTTLAKSDADAQAQAKQIADLQHKLTAAKAAEQAAAASPMHSAAPSGPVTPSPDDVTTATYWASMEAENAAQVAQALPPEQTARIFAAMKPDQVAEIMNVLPAAYNVKLKNVRMSDVATP